MSARSSRSGIFGERLIQLVALLILLALGGLALAGPYGVLAWDESRALLEKREQRIAQLEEKRDEYANLVRLLDPENVDPDLAAELARRNLNVAHPDEYIIQLETD